MSHGSVFALFVSSWCLKGQYCCSIISYLWISGHACVIHEDHEGKKYGLVYLSGFILPILFLIFLVLRTLPYLVYTLAWLCVVLLSAKVEDALCRLRRQLALRPPLLDKAIEDAQQLRPLAARALLETSQSSNHADWELARLKPELMIYEKQTKELKQEIQQLTGLISQAECRETECNKHCGGQS